MAAVNTIHLSRHSRQEVRLGNLLITRRPILTFDIADQTCRFYPGVINRFSANLDQPPLTTLMLSAGTGSVRLDLDQALFTRLVTPWVDSEQARSLPPELYQAVLTAALSPFFKVLRPLFGVRLALASESRTGTDGGLPLGLWETLDRTGRPAAILTVDAELIGQLQATLESMEADVEPDYWQRLAVSLTVHAGRMRITTLELADLDNDDVLLLPATVNADSYPLTLCRNDRALAMGTLQGRLFTLTRILENTTMPDDDYSDDKPQAVADLDALEITLRFDLGQLTLPLSELRQIQPGYSFELNIPADGQVRIVSGGQLLGQGELVQIEDRLGVRVTALFKSDNV